ncbi:MAG: type II toxin-antitoxin system RelE/ParE family toxin [Bacteroidota bacterium]
MPALKSFSLSKQAANDLDEIFDYTFHEFGLDQAVRYLNEFDVTFSDLVSNPKIGKDRSEIKKGLRAYTKSHHVIFYRIQDHVVRIVRVLHANRDLPQLIS